MKVSASILSNKYKPQDIVKTLNNSNVDYIHLDIMDGKFTKNKTWTYSQVKNILSNSNKLLDVHLMVNKPSSYIKDYALLNASYITFHLESSEDIINNINLIKSYGLKAGLSISPSTDIEKIYKYLKYIDLVLVMCVIPGESGQSFIEDSLNKITLLKEEINKQNVNVLIEVDGGINNITALPCKEHGADILVSASYIHEDIINNINILRDI